MAKRFIQRQEERNKKRGRRSQLQGLPGHQSYKGTLIGDVADTVRGRASNLPAVKPPSRPRVRTVSVGNMRSSKSTLRQMNRLSKKTSYGLSERRSKKR